MATKGLVVYLLTGFSVAIMSVYFIRSHSNGSYAEVSLLSSSNSNLYGYESKVWPVSYRCMYFFLGS